MLGFFRRKRCADNQTDTASDATQDDCADDTSLFRRLKTGLQKTRQQLTQSLKRALGQGGQCDDETLDHLETQLLLADVGVETTQRVLNVLKTTSDNTTPALTRVKQTLVGILAPCERTLAFSDTPPTTVLVVGINGAGKTTTIGKLASSLKAQGKQVMLAAGDTFRAAAVEQLQVWGARNDIPVIAQPGGKDSASVVYDALQSAYARGTDVLLADTAGRLHTQSHLMAELAKVKRVIKKLQPDGPHEVLLILDATIGQNALVQAREFHRAIGVTGIVLTKLDGTAKGGVIFALADQLALPIYAIGVGEHIDDLRAFDAQSFVDALLPTDELTDQTMCAE